MSLNKTVTDRQDIIARINIIKSLRDFVEISPDGEWMLVQLEACLAKERIAIKALEYVARGPRPDDSDSAVAKQALNKIEAMNEKG